PLTSPPFPYTTLFRSEKGIRLDVSQESSLEILTNESLRHVVLMTLGNLIDNAFTAVTKVESPIVCLLITDIGNNIVIEIDDIVSDRKSTRLNSSHVSI